MAMRDGRAKRRVRQEGEQPRTIVFTFRLREGATEREADEAAGFIAAAFDDAAVAYRSHRGGVGLYDAEGGPVVAAEARVHVLH